MAKTTVPGLYIADGAITAAKLSSTLDLSGVTITVATASTGDNDTTVASTAFVQQEIAALVDSSPSALNTLNELAAAIGDDASFSTTVTNSIATKLPLAGGTLTGNLIINTTGSIQIPVGTTAQRPTAAQGQLRFNTTTSKPEIYSGSAWTDVGGGVESVNSATGVVVLTTANITENTNLYYTDARADARIAAADTDDLSEGSTNLYFTTARANSAFDGRLSGSTGVTVSNGAVSIGQDVATSTSPTFQNLTLSGTDSIKVPSGTTAQRSGSPANGMLRYNSSTNEFEGYADSAWGAIGGDTTSSVDLYTATGNGSTATYDTGKNPQSENNTWVFVGGVYQPKSTYSFSGTQITLSENLPNGEDLEVITGTVSTYNPTDAILGQYNTTTSNTASYDTSLTTENENNVFVFVDGVYQPKSSYTYSGSTLTLDAVPTSGMALEVLVTRSMNAATVTTGFLADDAVTTVKILDANVTAGKLASSLDLTGKTVTVATASTGDNDTSVASTAFVRQEITALVDSAPAAMDTLNELAAALGDDANFSTTVNASIAAKLPLAGGTMTGDLILGDNVKLEIGSASGGDLQIYHDGTNSFIKDTAANLVLNTDSLLVSNAANTENIIVAQGDGAVTLYHNNLAKIATTSTGIDVTGTATMDGLTVDGYIQFTDSGSSNRNVLYLDGSNNVVLATGTTAGARGIDLYTNNSKSLSVAEGGDISFYEDTGSTAKFFWDASAERLGIGTTSPNGKLTISNSSAEGFEFSPGVTNFGVANTNYIASYDRNASTYRDISFDVGGTAGTAIRFKAGGSVGIGTSNPESKLAVKGSSGNADLFSISDITVPTSGVEYGTAMIKTNSTEYALNITSYNANGKGLRIYNNGGQNAFLISQAGGDRFVVDGSGNVGIGEDDPQTKLHVFGTDPVVRISDDSTSGFPTLELRQQNTNTEGSELMYDSSTGHTHLNTIYSGGDLKIATNTGSFGTTTTNTRLAIKADGVIEIGKSGVGSDRIKFMGNTNVGAPNTSNHTTGTRLSLYDSGTNSWYAIGIESDTMWFHSDGNYNFYQDNTRKIQFDGSAPMPVVRAGPSASNAMRLGSVTAVFPYSGPTFIRAVASASYTVHDSTNTTTTWLNLATDFPDYLTGLASINTINTSQQANIIFYLNTATKVYMTRQPGWNSVSLTGWDRISNQILMSDGLTHYVYVKWLQAGTHSLDNDSALYFFEAPIGP